MPLEQPLADLRNVRLCRLMLKPKIKLKLILLKPDLNLNVVDVCKCIHKAVRVQQVYTYCTSVWIRIVLFGLDRLCLT